MLRGAQKNSKHPATKHWIVQCSLCGWIIAQCPCELTFKKIITFGKCKDCKTKPHGLGQRLLEAESQAGNFPVAS